MQEESVVPARTKSDLLIADGEKLLATQTACSSLKFLSHLYESQVSLKLYRREKYCPVNISIV